MWNELAINPTRDSKAIRRAYAARLRTIDPDCDLQAFTCLRAALEQALTEAENPATSGLRLPPTDDQHIASDSLDFLFKVESIRVSNGGGLQLNPRLADATETHPDWIAARAA